MHRRIASTVLCLTALSVACALAPAAAFADRAYTARFGAVERGDVAIVANTSMSCPTGAPTCAEGRAGDPTIRNSAFTMTHVDVDSDATTFNSSSAELRLPAGATVLFAGLYWGSDTKAGAGGVDAPDAAAKGTVRLATGSTWAYQSVTATQIDTSRVYPTRYQGFADVTDRVRAAGPGTYSVANVQAATGADNFGGWGLVVAYRDPARPVRWLGVYDGFRQFTDDNTFSSSMTGFRTPATGTVEAAFGLLTYEGDIAVGGDIMQINGRDVSDALHPVGNYFNSRITTHGEYVTGKNPDFLNQMGHEASIVDIDGFLPNDSTTAAVRMGVATDYVQTGPMTLVADQAASAPAATAPPAVSGEAREGSTLTATTGTWTGTAPMTHAYAWLRCDAAGSACTDIQGATSQTYALTSADGGATLRVRVTAKNVVGSTGSTSAPTSEVQSRPALVGSPAVTGIARDGETLTASPGTWSGSPSFAYRWRRCVMTCTDITGATAVTYLLTAADVGATIRVRVTATNAAGSTSADSAPTATVVERAPVNTAAPSIVGTARDGETLTADPGSWGGSPRFDYQWRRCDPACTNVDGATGSAYVLGPADVGATLRVRVTATNEAGSTTAESAGTATVAARPPANTSAPGVTGEARDGETLTASTGGWSGTPVFGYGYKWRRCDGAGAGCVDIAGATAATYSLTAADVGRTLRVRVIATNAGGSGTADSAPTAAVLPKPPVNSVPPAITGTARENETLTASPGTWNGSPTYTYQWRRCTATCSDAGTGVTYVLGPEDVGATMRVRVTATNAGGSATAESDPTTAIVERAPANTVAPSISGEARDGQTLTAAPGSWSPGSPSFAYRWRRCAATCADIDGATAGTYVLTPDDVGRAIRVRVTATNASGSGVAESAPTAAVIERPPSSDGTPAISGEAREGQTVTVTRGTWTGNPTFQYRWRRCDASGGACADIAGATLETYVLVGADVGRTLRAVVTATNSGGSVTKTSAPTGVVLQKPPLNSVAPGIAGTPRDGETLTASPGTWSGDPTYVYQWRRCTGTCVDAGSGASTYDLGPADVGATIRVRVTATNGGGSATAESAPTAPVSPRAPVNETAPAISGSAQEGQTLTASSGTWVGTPTIAYAYQWRRCATVCADVPGATAKTFQLSSADRGATMRVRVTATNAGGSTTADSTPTAVVVEKGPVNSVPPAVTGIARDGETLTASTGSWSGSPTFTFQWRRCVSACVDITDATSSSYALTADDVGATIQVRVTARNSGGPVIADSAATPVVVEKAPVNTAAPAITGTARDGETLTAAPGTWSGSPSLAYQWRRCDAGCADIEGATGTAYVLSPNDVGRTIRVRVTATNGGGGVSADSPATAAVTARPPVNTATPTVSGTSREGETLTASAGTWTGTPVILHAFRWRRCDGPTCADIDAATGATYVPVAADVGRTLRVRVTGTNAGGSATADSAATGPVAAKPFVEPPVTEPPVGEPPVTQPPGVEPPPVQPPGAACDALTATYTRGRTGTLRLRLRLTTPVRSVQFAIPSAMLPTRAAAGRRSVGTLRLARATGRARSIALRFQRTSRSGLSAGGAPRIRLVHTGAYVSGIERRIRRVDLVLTTRRPAPLRSDATILALSRTRAGALLRTGCALPARR